MYESKTQYSDTDMVELMNVHSTLYIQKVCGTFLYYAISLDQTMLVALNTIYTAQAHATTTTMGDTVWLLNYVATQSNATLHYRASDMILHFTRDASYVCKERAHIQADGHSPLAEQLIKYGNRPPNLPTNNGDIHTMCQLIKTVIFEAL